MRKPFNDLPLLAAMCLLTVTAAAVLWAQSGGAFQIRQSAVASGGSTSSGGNFAVTGTVGQDATSASSNATFNLRSGFWTPPSSAPTAAGVTIGGQIRTAEGVGIANVHVSLTDASNGESKHTHSSSFGFYRLDDVPVGRIYILSVASKRFAFESDTRVISVLDEITGEDFIANKE